MLSKVLAHPTSGERFFFIFRREVIIKTAPIAMEKGRPWHLYIFCNIRRWFVQYMFVSDEIWTIPQSVCSILLTELRANSTKAGRTLVLSGLNVFTTERDISACFPSAHIEMAAHDTQCFDAAHDTQSNDAAEDAEDAQSVDAAPDRRSVSRKT